VSSESHLETLWKHVLDHWDEEAAHRAFLEHCRVQDALVEAAVRYRGMKADRTKGPLAEKKLAAIAMLAMTKLEVLRTQERPRRIPAVGIALVVAFLGATFGLLAYLARVR
jgi:hypothetical protein